MITNGTSPFGVYASLARTIDHSGVNILRLSDVHFVGDEASSVHNVAVLGTESRPERLWTLIDSNADYTTGASGSRQ